MGNENVIKDPNIEIFLQLKQLIHFSGDRVKGCVYIEVKQYSQYSDLILRIDCFQRTQNDEIKDKNKEALKQQRNTYYEELNIGQFLNGLYKGHYEFPFFFKLPQNIPGSLVLSKNDYIRYRITAYLQSMEPTLTNQMHFRQVWILQKFRGIPESILIRQIQESKCCMFGYSYGSVQTILEFQSNVIQPGQKIKLKLEINTHRMNTSIKKTTIRLLQKILIITNGNKQQKEEKELFAFDFNQNILERGQSRKMQKYVIFSVDINPTSIGQILTRYYVIETKLNFDCYTQIKQQHHFFVSSNKNGINEQNKPFSRPKKWKPVKHERKQFNELRKYDYKPHELIPFHNQLSEKVHNLELMKQIQIESSRRLHK